MDTGIVIGFRVQGLDRIWLWVCYSKIPIYPTFYLLEGDYRSKETTVLFAALTAGGLLDLIPGSVLGLGFRG